MSQPRWDSISKQNKYLTPTVPLSHQNQGNALTYTHAFSIQALFSNHMGKPVKVKTPVIKKISHLSAIIDDHDYNLVWSGKVWFAQVKFRTCHDTKRVVD